MPHCLTQFDFPPTRRCIVVAAEQLLVHQQGQQAVFWQLLVFSWRHSFTEQLVSVSGKGLGRCSVRGHIPRGRGALRNPVHRYGQDRVQLRPKSSTPSASRGPAKMPALPKSARPTPTSNAKATICSPDPTMSLSRSGSWTHLLTPRKFWSPKAIGSSHGQPRARKAMHTPDPRSHNRRRTGLSLHSRHRGMPWPSMGPSTPVTGACQCSFVAPSR